MVKFLSNVNYTVYKKEIFVVSHVESNLFFDDVFLKFSTYWWRKFAEHCVESRCSNIKFRVAEGPKNFPYIIKLNSLFPKIKVTFVYFFQL